MKTTTVNQIASVFTDIDGLTHTFEYTTLEELCYQIFDFFCENNSYFKDDDNLIILPDGETFYWSHCYAHYYFAKGRISFDEFIKLTKSVREEDAA